MDLSVLVVSYNTREDTLACLESVFVQTTRTRFEVVVVDNASNDGSADAIEERYRGRLKLLRSGKNLGFAAANNLGAGMTSGRYLLLLNPDTIVLDAALDRLVAFADERSGAGIWGGRTVFSDGSLNPGSCWMRPTPWSAVCQAFGLATAFRGVAAFNPEGIGGWPRDTVRAVDIVSGCFLLLRRELWNSLEGFDPAFFMYGEDADLCLRARVLGASPLICPDAVIVHHGGRSERVRAEKIIRLYQARMQLIDRHWSRAAVILGRLLQRLNVLRRLTIWKTKSALGNRAASEAACVFAEVWRRRAEWLCVSRETVRGPRPSAACRGGVA